MMSILSLPLVGQLYVPLLLTSLIVGVLILILLEKRNFKWDYDKISRQVFTEDVNSVKGISSTQSVATKGGVEGKYDDDDAPKKIEVVTTAETSTELEGKENRRGSTGSTTCSSNSEDDTAAAVTRPTAGVGRVRKVHKKHKCGSSDQGTKTCSKKKAVTSLTLVADIEDEQIKSSLEDLTAQFKTGGLTCSVIPSQEMNHSTINRDTTHLHLFVVSSELQQDLHQYTETKASKGQPPFLYSVLCLAPTNTPEITVSGEVLCEALNESGGNEWLPLDHITLDENTQGSDSTQKYITKVLNKISKQSKKCCGSSCSSKKAVDIEDLVSSLVPEVMQEKL